MWHLCPHPGGFEDLYVERARELQRERRLRERERERERDRKSQNMNETNWGLQGLCAWPCLSSFANCERSKLVSSSLWTDFTACSAHWYSQCYRTPPFCNWSLLFLFFFLFSGFHPCYQTPGWYMAIIFQQIWKKKASRHFHLSQCRLMKFSLKRNICITQSF